MEPVDQGLLMAPLGSAQFKYKRLAVWANSSKGSRFNSSMFTITTVDLICLHFLTSVGKFK